MGPGLDAAAREAALRSLRDQFSAVLAEKEMSNVQLVVEEVPDLRPDPKTGKFKLVVHAPA